MDTDLRKLRKLIKLMRSEGVLSLKQAGIELQISPAAILQEKISPKSKEEPTQPIDQPSYSETETLFWSSPGLMPEESVQ